MSAALKAGRCFLFRLPKGSDIHERLAAFCRRNNVRCAAVTIIGATEEVRLGYYDLRRRKYFNRAFKGAMEILSCLGNVSLKEGEPFAHLHAVMGDSKLRVRGGHLFPGSKLFAAEVYLRELRGQELARRPDPQTGLALWPCPFQDK